jgi:outer membrane receptor for ferrienterochelin and colicin
VGRHRVRQLPRPRGQLRQRRLDARHLALQRQRSYDITDHLRVSLAVDNLFDKMPPRDATWANYPYYDTSWFDSIGRSYYLQFTWKLGGKAL